MLAIIGVCSRKILSCLISNTLDAAFCFAALEEAIAMYGVLVPYDTDQGCQFLSETFPEEARWLLHIDRHSVTSNA